MRVYVFIISYIIILSKRKRPFKLSLFHRVTKFGGIRKLQTYNDLASHVFSKGRSTAITTATSRVYTTTSIFIERTLRSFVTTTIPPAITDVISITFSVPFAARAKLEITAIVRHCREREGGRYPPLSGFVSSFAVSVVACRASVIR